MCKTSVLRFLLAQKENVDQNFCLCFQKVLGITLTT